MTVIPAGACETESPWLIQTDWSVGCPLNRVDEVSRIARGRGPELREPGLLDRATEGPGHGLEAVAHAEHRHPGLEQRGVEGGRTLLVDRRRATGQDHRGGVLREHLGHGHRVRHDLAEAAGLPHPARDQLRVLGAEVDDEHGPVGEVHRRSPVDDHVVGVVVMGDGGVRAGGVAHAAKVTGGPRRAPTRPPATPGARPRTTGTAHSRRA